MQELGIGVPAVARSLIPSDKTIRAIKPGTNPDTGLALARQKADRQSAGHAFVGAGTDS